MTAISVYIGGKSTPFCILTEAVSSTVNPVGCMHIDTLNEGHNRPEWHHTVSWSLRSILIREGIHLDMDAQAIFDHLTMCV